MVCPRIVFFDWRPYTCYLSSLLLLPRWLCRPCFYLPPQLEVPEQLAALPQVSASPGVCRPGY